MNEAAARPLVVLDLGNVLVDVDFRKFLLAARGDSTVLALESAAHEIANSATKLQHDRGHLNSDEFFVALPEILGDCILQGAALKLAWSNIFSFRQDARDFLRDHEGEFEFWLFSDTDPIHFGWILKEYPELRGWPRYLLSFERRCLKRDAGAFFELAEEARHRPVVFVDDLEVNVRAATVSGVSSVLFRSWPETTILIYEKLATQQRATKL